MGTTKAQTNRGDRPRRWGSFPTTADVGIWATGASSAALFEALGLGLYALMNDLRKVPATGESRGDESLGRDPTELVVAFLTELPSFSSRRTGSSAATSGPRPVGDQQTAVVASVSGERFDPDRHTSRTEVKAVTLHGLVFDQVRGQTRVIVDI